MPGLRHAAGQPLPEPMSLPTLTSRQVIRTEVFRYRSDAVHRFNEDLAPLGWRLFSLQSFFAAHAVNATDWLLIVSREIPG
jgi:hypothetical protein